MCGVLGVIGPGPVIGDIVDGLLFLQHRGQDAAGAATYEACFESVGGPFRRCRGSYSVCAVVAGVGLLAFRDPFGIKPLVFGKKGTGDDVRWMVASESCALESLGYTVERDVKPGEAI